MASAKKAQLKAQQAIRSGDYARAEQILAKANADRAGRSLDNLVLQARVQDAQQNFTAAVATLEAAESAARTAAERAKILTMLADLLCSRPRVSTEDTHRAIAYLEQSLTLRANTEKANEKANEKTRKNLCALYYRLCEYDDCERHALQLLESPVFATLADLWVASCRLYLNRQQSGESHVLRAAETADGLATPDLVWLIETLLNYRRFDEARAIIDTAVATGKDDLALRNMQARLSYEQRDYARVIELTTEDLLNANNADTGPNVYACFIRGRSLDASGRYAEAHDCFVRMNRFSRQGYPQPVARDYTQAWAGIDLKTLPVHALSADIACVPVFMIAFPRSGTTLLDTILDTQDGITTLSETECILAVRNAMEALGKTYPEDLPLLSAAETDRLRAVYFDEIGPYLDPQDVPDVLIDKVPLNLLHLPLIKILFPDARFIFSLRHPLDVCLSCFQQGFQLNDEMLHFTALESTFKRYRDVMTLFGEFRNALSPDLLTVRYEDLVEDLDATAMRVFDFLGVEPSDAYRRFDEINQQKFSATPSRDQVTRPLYQSSRERWRHYEAFIRPHIDIVRPLLDEFGYEI